jgi:hypothetical protein
MYFETMYVYSVYHEASNDISKMKENVEFTAYIRFVPNIVYKFIYQTLFIFSVVCVAQCLLFCVVLCRSLFVFSVVYVAHNTTQNTKH